MSVHISRRTLLAGVATSFVASARKTAAEPRFEWSYPLSRNGGTPGEGFFIRHGFGCENPRYYPGWTHTGENWYGTVETTAGADVISTADGIVSYAGYDYPGHVVIVEHSDGLFSVYGHLDYSLAVTVGDTVVRGQRLGAVLARQDEYARSHLHFEIRTFFTQDSVNGNHPRHGTNCGYRCPPGPGYWPTDAPEHPADLGWLNPTHVIARRGTSGLAGAGEVVATTNSEKGVLTVWNDLPWRNGSQQIDDLSVLPGDRFRLVGVKSGSEAVHGRSAAGYRLWYHIELPAGDSGWVSAIAADATDRNTNGSPAGVHFNLLPAF